MTRSASGLTLGWDAVQKSWFKSSHGKGERVSYRKRVVASGLAALLISLSVVALIALSGAPSIQLPLTSGTQQVGGGGQTTTTGSSSGLPGTPSQSQGQGEFSVLLTDPPRVPAGVTAVYVYYNDLAVHGPGGWTTMKAAGDIEVLGTVNFGETLASANLPSGQYDRVSFDVASAVVTYDGVNYTSFVQGGQLTMRVEGGSVVSASQAAAAIIDIQPTVVNVGGASAPRFVLWAEAMAFPVPSAQIHASFMTEGYRLSLAGQGWWDGDLVKANSSLRLSSVSLSSGSLSLTVADVGSSGAHLKMVVVSPSSMQMGGESSVPAYVTGSAVLVVLPNGTLDQFRPLLHVSMPYIRGENQSSIFDALLMAGYNLSAGSSATLSYAGTIALSFGLLGQPLGITSGTTYWVTVIGDNAVASAQVTAG